MNNKRKLAIGCVFLYAAAAMGSGTDKSLRINYKDGSATNIELTSQPHVTVSDGNMTVTHDNGEMTVDISTVRNFTVGELSGISDLTGATPVLRWISPTQVTVTGVTEVRVYALNGAMLYSGKGDVTLDLEKYAEKMIIINADDKAFKILKK